MLDEGLFADDDGGSPIGMGVEPAVPAPVSAARAGLGRAVRRNGDGGYAEFGGFLLQEFADVADGRLGEAPVEFALGGHVLAGRSEGATGGRLHIDGAKAFDGDHLGLGFQQDFADLATHILVAALGVTRCPLPILGDGVAPSFAVTGLAGDVSLVLALSVAATFAALVVGTMTGADREVVLGAPVSAENVCRALNVQSFQWYGFRYGYLNVNTVVPAMYRRAWSVVFHRYELD